jgi:hypothetical protein
MLEHWPIRYAREKSALLRLDSGRHPGREGSCRPLAASTRSHPTRGDRRSAAVSPPSGQAPWRSPSCSGKSYVLQFLVPPHAGPSRDLTLARAARGGRAVLCNNAGLLGLQALGSSSILSLGARVWPFTCFSESSYVNILLACDVRPICIRSD